MEILETMGKRRVAVDDEVMYDNVFWLGLQADFSLRSSRRYVANYPCGCLHDLQAVMSKGKCDLHLFDDRDPRCRAKDTTPPSQYPLSYICCRMGRPTGRILIRTYETDLVHRWT